MELRDYLRILRRGWPLVLCFILVGTTSGVLATIATPKRFHSSTTLTVSVLMTDDWTIDDLLQSANYAKERAQSYVELATSAQVLEPVVEELDLDVSTEALAQRVSASNPSSSPRIAITVVDASAQGAAETANAIGRSLRSFVNELESSPSGTSLVRVETTSVAQPPRGASSPDLWANVGFGFLLGLAVGLAAAVLRTVLDRRIRGPYDIEAIVDAPIIGGITRSREPGGRLEVDTLRGAPTEAFRALVARLQFVDLATRTRVYVVASTQPGDGASPTATNIAAALAAYGARVALVDADLRRPRVAEILGVSGEVGLGDVLAGRVALADAVQTWEDSQLSVLPAGHVPPNLGNLLGSEAMRQVLSELHAANDYVLIDAPPLLQVADAAVLARLAGGVLLVTSAGQTRKSDLKATARLLDGIDCRLLGVVITQLPVKGPNSYQNAPAYGAHSEAL